MNAMNAYKKVIKAKFEIEKSRSNSDFFLNPSPAKFKKMALLIYETNMNAVDEEIFNRFFCFNEGKDKITQIKNFDTDRFRPFQSFLIKNTDITQMESLNLIAVFVDFSPRPYLKFRKMDIDGKVNFVEGVDEVVYSGGGNFSKTDSNKYIKDFEPIKRLSFKKKVWIGLISIIIMMPLGFGIKKLYFPNKNSMVWVNDHYEAIIYEEMTNKDEAKPINQDVLDHFKKIKVCDTTTFFRNGMKNQPLIWYGKDPKTGEYDLFNQPGVHPITEETLKKITPYIIEKYFTNK